MGLFGDCVYLRGGAGDIEAAAAQVVGLVDDRLRAPVRIVFFGGPADNREYGHGMEVLGRAVSARWGARAPVVSYVAQPPLDGATLAAEVHYAGAAAAEYKNYGSTPYIVLSGAMGRRIVAGGIRAADPDAGVDRQSDEVFEVAGGILAAEGMKPHDIVRQWNYIERITDFDGGAQRYQQFNDSRSAFYAGGSWGAGYPAATGIGTRCGGVVVEFDALVPAAGVEVASVDNPLQMAAHDYSKQVLLGEGSRSTPKFERAKAVWSPGGGGTVYISGTAAIRGEQSVEGRDIERQTAVTLENIDCLTGRENLGRYGVAASGEAHYQCLRVYLKDAGSLERARSVVERSHAHVPALYVLSDICRCELLVEIEGIATITS